MNMLSNIHKLIKTKKQKTELGMYMLYRNGDTTTLFAHAVNSYLDAAIFI